MGHNHDFWEKLRTALARPIGAIVGRGCVKQSADQFVGYVEMGEEEFEKRLHEMDFHRNPLSFWKRVPKLGPEHGSWRKNDGEWQIHAVLYEKSVDGELRTYIYAHWEYRWDRRPIKHLLRNGLNSTKGVNEMRREMNLASINYYNDPSVR